MITSKTPAIIPRPHSECFIANHFNAGEADKLRQTFRSHSPRFIRAVSPGHTVSCISYTTTRTKSTQPGH